MEMDKSRKDADSINSRENAGIANGREDTDSISSRHAEDIRAMISRTGVMADEMRACMEDLPDGLPLKERAAEIVSMLKGVQNELADCLWKYRMLQDADRVPRKYTNVVYAPPEYFGIYDPDSLPD